MPETNYFFFECVLDVSSLCFSFAFECSVAYLYEIRDDRYHVSTPSGVKMTESRG